MMKQMTCIICPRGCSLTVNTDDMTVTGNTCPKGKQYATLECTHPVRTVTSTIKLANRDGMVSVKTKDPVAKADIFDVMRQIRAASAEAPIKIGDVLLADVAGTDIIATKNVE